MRHFSNAFPLRKINTGLSLVVLLLGLYIIFMPFLPMLFTWVKDATTAPPPLVQQNIASGATPVDQEVMPAENTLVVPGIRMQEIIYDGSSAATLSKGVWRRPHTSTPNAGSNTVLVGHRFTYTQPQGVFYSLDKIAPGDDIFLYWEQTKYHYKVQEVFVVKPTAVEVESATDEDVLTLYTCTPLWSGRDRLVIRAVLQGDQQ